MTIVAEMIEDPGIKRLLTTYPEQTLDVLAPELVHDEPLQEVVVVGQEVLRHATGQGGFLDVALRFSWPSASAVVLLVEHWSESRKVDLRRVLRYASDLHHKHREIELVLPVLLVTDPGTGQVQSHFSTRTRMGPVIDLRCRVVRTDGAFRAQWARARNRVAAVLSVLAPAASRLEAVLSAVRSGMSAPGPLEDWAWLLPLMEIWGKLSEVEREELVRLLREDPEMVSVVDVFRAEGRMEGRAEGRMEGALTLIELRRNQGRMTREEAIEEIQYLVSTELIDNHAAQKAIERLN